MRHVRWALALLLGVGVAGCERQPAAAPLVEETDPFANLGPGIHPVLVLAARTPESARVELHLKRVQVTAQVASYQGELTYDAARMKLSAAEFPAGLAGAWNEVEPGRVRFAAAAPSGVGDAAVLTLSFAATEKPSAEHFTLAMEEVVASEEFADLTPQVAQRPHPLFSETQVQPER